jgi:hypothetical protein
LGFSQAKPKSIEKLLKSCLEVINFFHTCNQHFQMHLALPVLKTSDLPAIHLRNLAPSGGAGSVATLCLTKTKNQRKRRSASTVLLLF